MWVSGTKGNKTKYSAFEAHVQKCKEQSIERDSRAGSSNFYFVFLIEQFQPLLLEDALENQKNVFTCRPFYIVRSLKQGRKPKTLIEHRLSKRTSFLADLDATKLIVNFGKWFRIASKNTENQNLRPDRSILYRCHDQKLTCQGWKRSGGKTLSLEKKKRDTDGFLDWKWASTEIITSFTFEKVWPKVSHKRNKTEDNT